MTEAEALGCKCSECPLRGMSEPVLPEANAGARIMVVGDYPSERESTPFTGPLNEEMTTAMKQGGAKRREVHWTNALLCRPPKGDYKTFMLQLGRANRQRVKENKERAKNGEEPLMLMPSPLTCCGSRLSEEMAGFSNIIVSGGIAVKAVIGPSASIMSLRGGRIDAERDGKALRIMPTLHPSFVTAKARWTRVFRSDVHRALRWFDGEVAWRNPKIFYNPTPAQLERYLNLDVPYWTYDVETDGIECLTANVRCIAIGTAEHVAVLGFRTIEGQDAFYAPSQAAMIKEILRDFFVADKKLKVGHNAGYYDRIVIEEFLGVTPTPLMDTMLLHRLCESELPHSLAFVGSIYADAPSWKTDREGRKKSTQSETDAELHEYCAMDVAVTARVVPPLFEQLRLRKQDIVYPVDQKMQEICAEMHRVGMYVDQKKRHQWEVKLSKDVYSRRVKLRDICGVPDFNPGSVYQVRRVLFQDWKLDPPIEDKLRYTIVGDPSTSDDVLRSLLTVDLTDQQKAFVLNLRRYRAAQKALGTYVVKLRPWNMRADQGWDDDETFEERDARIRYGEAKRGIVDPRTGRMHPGYNAHVTTTGRLSSSKPINAQNFPGTLRAMVTPAPGHILVGADADQLELRIAAARWKAKRYLEAFHMGEDPHSVTARGIFGPRFDRAKGHPSEDNDFRWEGDAKALRNLAKRVQYASQYWATVETVHRVISQTETDNGDGTTDLPYLRLSLREVRKMHKKWLEAAPEFADGWEKELSLYRDQGFGLDPVGGRRRDFLDGENPNEIVNFPIQASGAALMNLATLRIVEEIPWGKWGEHTGLINQCHDSLVIECPEDKAEYVAQVLEEALNQTHPGLAGVTFTASADTGMSWKEVG